MMTVNLKLLRTILARDDNSLSHSTLNVLMLKFGSIIFETIENFPYRFVFLSALICVLKVRVETNSPNLCPTN